MIQVTRLSDLVDHRDGGVGEHRRVAAAQPLQARVEVARCVAKHIQQAFNIPRRRSRALNIQAQTLVAAGSFGVPAILS